MIHFCISVIFNHSGFSRDTRMISGLGTLYDDVHIAEMTGHPETEIRQSVILGLKSFVQT